MRIAAIMMLVASVIHAAVWGVFRSTDPEYFKLMTFALLLGIFLSLPILKTDRSSWTTFFLALAANAFSGAVTVAGARFAHSEYAYVAVSIFGSIVALAGAAFIIVGSKRHDALYDTFGPMSWVIRATAGWRAYRRRSDAVSDNFVSELWPRAICGAIGLLLLSSIALYTGDFYTAAISLFLCCIVVAHLVLTKLRVGDGSFASNAEEAAELISYILSHQKRTGHPPGGRLSADAKHEATSEPNAIGAIRGGT